jgi:hypothetical protein
MKKFLKFIGIVILLAIVFVLVAGLFIKKEYHFERSVVINAPKEEIWKNISHFSNFEKWDPWLIHDPHMKRTISGTDGNPGAVYKWKGNKDVGSGSQTYVEIDPYNHIDIVLQFKEPFENNAFVKYTLTPEGRGYKVTWGFDTKFPYPMNAVTNLFLNMDKNLDKDFSSGLANLKKLCESNATYTAFNKEPASQNTKTFLAF